MEPEILIEVESWILAPRHRKIWNFNIMRPRTLASWDLEP